MLAQPLPHERRKITRQHRDVLAAANGPQLDAGARGAAVELSYVRFFAGDGALEVELRGIGNQAGRAAIVDLPVTQCLDLTWIAHALPLAAAVEDFVVDVAVNVEHADRCGGSAIGCVF